MDNAKMIRQAKGFAALRNRFDRVKPIILKRRSAFTIYEWIEIQKILNIIE